MVWVGLMVQKRDYCFPKEDNMRNEFKCKGFLEAHCKLTRNWLFTSVTWILVFLLQSVIQTTNLGVPVQQALLGYFSLPFGYTDARQNKMWSSTEINRETPKAQKTV